MASLTPAAARQVLLPQVRLLRQLYSQAAAVPFTVALHVPQRSRTDRVSMLNPSG